MATGVGAASQMAWLVTTVPKNYKSSNYDIHLSSVQILYCRGGTLVCGRA